MVWNKGKRRRDVAIDERVASKKKKKKTSVFNDTVFLSRI